MRHRRSYRAMIEDVPSPIDLRLMADAREWEATATLKRPWRREFFAQFIDAIATAPIPVHRILELGSGPGFLAEQLLRDLPSVSYVALDFSDAMHQLSAERLGSHVSNVQFVTRNFREADWANGLGQFECVVTNQAVHELRHKRYASALHKQVRQLLSPSGLYLVCDHFAGKGGMQNEQLYMLDQEQKFALLDAGFTKVEQLLNKGGLVLHHAT